MESNNTCSFLAYFTWQNYFEFLPCWVGIHSSLIGISNLMCLKSSYWTPPPQTCSYQCLPGPWKAAPSFHLPSHKPLNFFLIVSFFHLILILTPTKSCWLHFQNLSSDRFAPSLLLLLWSDTSSLLGYSAVSCLVFLLPLLPSVFNPAAMVNL